MTRFGRDQTAAGIQRAPLIAEDNLTEVAQFSQRFYSTSSVRYMLYADVGKYFWYSLWESGAKPSRLSVGFSCQTITLPIPKYLWCGST